MNQLKAGIRVEMEHKKTLKKFIKPGVSFKKVAKIIAKAHIAENKKYYTVLKKAKL